jgi:hypothetical protein
MHYCCCCSTCCYAAVQLPYLQLNDISFLVSGCTAEQRHSRCCFFELPGGAEQQVLTSIMIADSSSKQQLQLRSIHTEGQQH